MNRPGLAQVSRGTVTGNRRMVLLTGLGAVLGVIVYDDVTT